MNILGLKSTLVNRREIPLHVSPSVSVMVPMGGYLMIGSGAHRREVLGRDGHQLRRLYLLLL